MPHATSHVPCATCQMLRVTGWSKVECELRLLSHLRPKTIRNGQNSNGRTGLRVHCPLKQCSLPGVNRLEGVHSCSFICVKCNPCLQYSRRTSMQKVAQIHVHLHGSSTDISTEAPLPPLCLRRWSYCYLKTFVSMPCVYATLDNYVAHARICIERTFYVCKVAPWCFLYPVDVTTVVTLRAWRIIRVVPEARCYRCYRCHRCYRCYRRCAC